VAIAAVDSLAHAHRVDVDDGGSPDAPAAVEALAGALDHPDEDVAKAALLKLGSAGEALAALEGALGHPSAAVRVLAAEILAERGERGG
jgi:HEAT repeat protein